MINLLKRGLKLKVILSWILTLAVLVPSLNITAYASLDKDNGFMTIGGGGEILQIEVGNQGSLAVYLMQNGSYVRQYYSEDAWGSKLFYTDSTPHIYSSPYAMPSGSTGFGIGSQQVLDGGRTVETSWTTAQQVKITQIIHYDVDQRFYTKQWKIENQSSATLTDLSWFHGGDTYFGGNDSARSYWDERLNMVYVKNQNMSIAGLMGFSASNTSPASAYYAGYYNDGNDLAANGQLDNTASSAYEDAGYYLQWDRSNLAPGDVWLIDATETWSAPGEVQVLAAAPKTVAPASVVSYEFTIQNFQEQDGLGLRDTFDISAVSSNGWHTNVTVGDSIAIDGGGQRATIIVELSVPEGASGTDNLVVTATSRTLNSLSNSATVVTTVDQALPAIRQVSINPASVSRDTATSATVSVSTANVSDGSSVQVELLDSNRQALTPRVLASDVITTSSAALVLDVSALSEGSYFVSVGVNGVAGTHNTTEFIILPDVTSPTYQVVGLTSSNPNSGYATIGDTITLKLLFNEAVNSPTIQLLGKHQSPLSSLGGTAWTVDYRVVADDPNGLVDFTVDYRDLAGNLGVQITPQHITTGSAVVVDTLGPMISGVAEGVTYKKAPIAYFYDGMATLDDLAFTSGSAITTNGPHTLIAKDLAGNQSSVHFVVDDLSQETYMYYGPGNDANHVTKNLDLVYETSQGHPVRWEVIGDVSNQVTTGQAVSWTNGLIQHTSGAAITAGLEDRQVTMRAYIEQNGQVVIKDFQILIKKSSDDQLYVNSDRDSIAITYALGDRAESVTKGIGLPSLGDQGSVVTWQSSQPNYIATDGRVIRPTYGLGDQTVRLTATLVKGDGYAIKVFTLVVKEALETDGQKVTADGDNLAIIYAKGDSDTHVTQGLGLPIQGQNGSLITWTSDQDNYVSGDGHVKRPPYGLGDQRVVLKAVITLGQETETRYFILLVKEKAKEVDPKTDQGSGGWVPGNNLPEEAETPGSDTQNGGSGNGESGTSTKSYSVYVNGQAVITGRETTTQTPDETIVQVEVDESLIRGEMERIVDNNSGDQQNVLKIPVGQSDPTTVGVGLTGDLVQAMEEADFDVEIESEGISYVIPAEEIQIESVASRLGVDVEALETIDIHVAFSKLQGDDAEAVQVIANKQGLEIVLPPVSFEITATAVVDGQTRSVAVSAFQQYATRRIAIPSDVDPELITTGVVVTLGGVSHIPTRVFEDQGVWYAELNSMTNSEYTIIWNPIKVASVEGHWAEEAVNNMASRLIIKNPDNFSPSAVITRGEFAEYLVKAIGLYRIGVAEAGTFSDLSLEDPLADALTTAKKIGIINGYGQGLVGADDYITREQAMTMFARTMAVIRFEKMTSVNTLDAFADASRVSSWAFESVKSVVGAGVFNGTTEYHLDPQGIFTFAEAAKAIDNLLKQAELINQ